MRYAGFLATVVASIMMASGGAAQSSGTGGAPQPAPPPGFEGSQYVDGRGCVYIRAGISGQVNWVPRVGADRTPICGPSPATIRPPVVAEAPQPAPAVVEPAPEPRQAAAPAPQVLTPPEAAPRQAAAATPIPPPRIIEVPRTPERSQPAARPAPAAEARQAAPVRRLTRSEVCAGRSGPLEGFVVASTGAPVNCGGSQRTVSAPARAPEAVRPTAVRVTRAEICARIAETGETFLDRSTGEPVACPRTAPAVTALARPPASAPPRTISAPLSAVPVRTTAAVPGVASCPGISAEAEAFLREIGAPLDCGPWSRSVARADVPASNLEAPSARTAPVSATLSGRAAPVAAPVVTAAAPTPLFRQPVPASNPTVLNPARSIASPPAGYRSVWDDGRVNPARGLARPYF
ncbi:hypothetical protein [Histidinibacterium lentulum]|nr:hypothetical protein [Histidinibacterium lentulum]